MSKKTVQPQDKYVLRLPDGMRDQLRVRAEKGNRSMNAEIVLRLQRSLWLEDNGLLNEHTTALDLISAPTGEQLVRTIRFLRQQAAEMIDMLEAEENRTLVESAKEFARREREERELGGSGTPDDHEDR